MSDVNILRALADCDGRAGEPLGKAMRSAAAEIERLQAELREAHKFLAIQLEAIEAFGITGGANDEVRAFLAKVQP